MTEERDPLLESLFAEARQGLVDERFTKKVMAGVKVRSRRVLLGRLALVALLIALEVLLESPLQHSLGVLTDVLGATLFAIDGEWLSFILAPLNSVAGLLGLALLGLHALYRRLFF